MMRRQFTRRIIIALAVLMTLGLYLDEASAQRRRPRRSRRVTNPVATRPGVPATTPSAQSTDPQIISTADQQANDQDNASEISGQSPASSRRTNRKRAAPEPESEEDSMRRTVNELSTTVNKLSDKLTQMQERMLRMREIKSITAAISTSARSSINFASGCG